MNHEIRLTVLVENHVRQAGLMAEHGLAYWIETPTHRVLFDTGQSRLAIDNARSLGIDLSQADAIVLSHGHYDHTGGLDAVLELAPRAKLHLHPKAVIERYTGRPGQTRSIGLGGFPAARLQAMADRLVWTDQPGVVVPSIHVTGQIPRDNEHEDTGGLFYLDAQASVPDPILDDQAIHFDTEQGVVIVLGCAHAGVINTIAHVSRLTGRPIHAVIGGMHLLQASRQRMDWTLQQLQAWPLAILAPMHCTGARATATLWQAFPQSIAEGCVGKQWVFPCRSLPA